jgi:hypothetical protein
MRDLNDLYFFVQTVDNGGFAPAARSLGMPKSRLSRRIAMLEERLGVRLLQRTTRRFAVTEVGQEYYRHCVAARHYRCFAHVQIPNPEFRLGWSTSDRSPMEGVR